MIPGAAEYRRRLSDAWIPATPDDPPDVSGWIGPKIDGECWIGTTGPGAELSSPTGISAPADAPIVAELRTLAPGLTLAGELIDPARPGPAGVRAALGSGAWGRLAWAPWDAPGLAWTAALAALAALPDGGAVAPVPWVRVAGRADIDRVIRSWGSSVEGAIVRADDGGAYKLKPAHHIDAMIVAVNADRSAVKLATVGGDGAAEIIGAAAIGPVDAAQLRPVDGPPDADGWTWTAPGPIVEVAALDVSPADRPRVRWTGAAWSGAAPGPSVALRHPRIVRLRPDRDDAPRAALAQLPRAALAVRRVWTRRSGAVAKLSVWPSPWGWSVAWTDYSPRRADALRRDVWTCPDEAAALALAARLEAARIRNGWTLHSATSADVQPR